MNCPMTRFCMGLALIYMGLINNQYTLSMTFYSQASQDKFVYHLLYKLLNKKDQGYYLEIGAGDPIALNNTYFFEKNFGWRGVSIDIADKSATCWHMYRNKILLIENALESDYRAILESFPKIIDYLSIDIDSHYDAVLEKIPFADYMFKVITIEHDFYRHNNFYRYGNIYREKERKILQALGYHLLCPDVMHSGCIFEDWWINPKAFPESIATSLLSLSLSSEDHEKSLQILVESSQFLSPS